MLTLTNVHVPISVSIGDSLEPEPTHICYKDPVELIRKFMEELEWRGKTIREKVSREFMPRDAKMLLKKQRVLLEQWCNEAPFVGFNCGSYDLNLIREHFVEL